MTPIKPKAKTYTVGNPQEVPKGIPLISQERDKEPEYPDGREWFEGDSYVPPASMNPDMCADWVARGILVEVTDG